MFECVHHFIAKLCKAVHFLLFACQIWDFNLGRSRDHNEKSAIEVGFGLNHGGFMIKSYSDMLKEISSGTTKDLEDIYDSRYCSTAEDIMSSNMCQLSSKNVSLLPLFPYVKDAWCAAVPTQHMWEVPCSNSFNYVSFSCRPCDRR